MGKARPTAQGTGEPARARRSALDLNEVLTAREFDVLELVSHGATNPEIAKELWVSPETVKTHVESIVTKLCSTNRTDAARLFGEWIGSSSSELD